MASDHKSKSLLKGEWTVSNRRNIGIVVTVLGLLMTCCACPLALDRLVSFGNRGIGFYAQTFPRLARWAPAVVYTSSVQVICISLLALVVLIVGIVVLVQARSNGSTKS
jgi:hypothetical protein